MRKRKVVFIVIISLIVTMFQPVKQVTKAASMEMSNAGLEMMKGFEGLRLTAYKVVPSEKYYTIGYGHYGSDVYEGMTITEAQAVQYLKEDLREAEYYVNRFLSSRSISMNQNQFDALVSFTYNLGDVWTSTPTFKLKTYLTNGIGNYTNDEITTAFTNWCKDGSGNVLEGLVSRRRKEAALFLSGTTQEVDAPKLEVWISNDKMGETVDNYRLGETYYVCYRLYDEKTDKKFNEVANSNYVVTETLYNEKNEIIYTTDYENSDYNWIGNELREPGTYKGVVEISGGYECKCEVEITINPISTPTPKITATPRVTIKPTWKVTATPRVTIKPTWKVTTTPQITVKPTPDITSTPVTTIKPIIHLAPTLEPVSTAEPTIVPDEEQEIETENLLEKGDCFETREVIYRVTGVGKNPTIEYVEDISSDRKSVVIANAVKYEGVTYKVTSIGKNAFLNNKTLENITIGKNVTYIGAKAFYGNKKLKKVIIKSSKITKVGKKAFQGLHKKATVAAPKSVKNKYKKLLKNAGWGKR